MALMGQMMSAPLLISSIIKHAARYYGSTEIVSRRTEGDLHRYTYRDCELRARKLAQALGALGVQQGDRVGTLAWNGYRHLEIYYGVSGMGAVCHTINPRLFPSRSPTSSITPTTSTCSSMPRSCRWWRAWRRIART
jgi:fatty-acyl-CoA synthase